MTDKYFAWEQQPTGNYAPVIYHGEAPPLSSDGRIKSSNGYGRRVVGLRRLNIITSLLTMDELCRDYPVKEPTE